MAQGQWRVDFTAANVLIIPTSGVDASVTLPPALGVGSPGNGGFWMMGVSGAPCYVNIGAAAAAGTCVLLPIGLEDTPKFRAGVTYHALAPSGTGQLWFAPAFPS